MTIDLAKLNFENDFCEVALPKGGKLIFNCIDEAIKIKDNAPIEINRINIQLIYTSETKSYYTTCSSVIGLDTDIMKIETGHKEYEGKILNKDNMLYCKAVVYD